MLLHKAKAKALPTRETVLYGVALTCYNPIRYSRDGQVEKAVKSGIQPEDAGVMGLQFEEGGESARLFTIDATDDDEIPGMHEGIREVARCLESSCTSIDLSDKSLYDYLHSEPRPARPLKEDARGHAVGANELPFVLLHTTIGGQGWWIAIEGDLNKSRSCEYVNLFPEVPVRSR